MASGSLASTAADHCARTWAGESCAEESSVASPGRCMAEDKRLGGDDPCGGRAWRSWGGVGLVVGRLGLVGLGGEEALGLRRVLDLALAEPALAVGVVVEGLGGVLQGGVDGGDLAGDGHVEVGDRLDGLDDEVTA